MEQKWEESFVRLPQISRFEIIFLLGEKGEILT